MTGLTYRGVCYDTGTNFDPGGAGPAGSGQRSLSRVVWDEGRMREDIRAIAEDLNCNAVTVYGTDLQRLAATSTAAAGHGLHVWLQPRLVDHPQAEILDHLAVTAAHAEGLRADGASVGLNIGCEHVFFTPHIVPGATYLERMGLFESSNAHPGERRFVDVCAAMGRLREFLARAAAVARDGFGGGVTYGAAPFEDVDWGIFDFVGLNYYCSYHPTADGYAAELERFREWGKPILICEFGTCTYAGAAERGGMAFDIVDRRGPQPVVEDGYLRDERAQADHLIRMLELFEQFGLHGASVYELVQPTHPHSPDPRLDLDTASMAI
ncbi:MAG TPA: abortive phage infection protein, partial [Pseudonocardiaceae bacterium]|nr:abortive phage infection protein [Pseudonocardiaceae bacterium]